VQKVKQPTQKQATKMTCELYLTNNSYIQVFRYECLLRH